MIEGGVSVFSDGGARGNPGPAACAFVVFVNGKIVFKDSKYLGITTNNFAEYQGVIMALEWLVRNSKFSKINFYLDSELIAKQINSVYKVKDKVLKNLFLKTKNLLERVETEIIFRNIPRSKNKLADFLVNRELDLKP